MIVLHTMERAYPWGSMRSTFSSKTKVVLEEKGLAYQVDRVRIGDIWKKTPEVLEKNPLGKVPWIEDGETRVYDSTVINEYLDDRYPEPSLLPGDPLDRARVRALENYGDEIVLGGPVPAIWMPWWSKEADRNAEDMARGRDVLRSRVLPFLEKTLDDRPYLAGDQFTLADTPYMAVAMVLQVDGMSLEGFPRFAAYLDRLRGRPSYRAIDPATSLEASAGSDG